MKCARPSCMVSTDKGYCTENCRRIHEQAKIGARRGGKRKKSKL